MPLIFSTARRSLKGMSQSLRPSLGSLAAMMAMALPVATNAQVIVSNIANVGFANGSVGVDIDGNGANDFQLFANGTIAEISALVGGNLIFSNGMYVDVFTNGAAIAPASANNAAAEFDTLTGSTGYVGVSFQRAGQAHAGWLLFDFTGGTGNPVNGGILTSAAWQSTAGASLAAGAIPEPAEAAAGFGLLAGLAAWFRRRRAKS